MTPTCFGAEIGDHLGVDLATSLGGGLVLAKGDFQPCLEVERIPKIEYYPVCFGKRAPDHLGIGSRPRLPLPRAAATIPGLDS